MRIRVEHRATGMDQSRPSQSFNMIELESIGIRSSSLSVCSSHHHVSRLLSSNSCCRFESIGLEANLTKVGRLVLGLNARLDPSVPHV
jgi:hypothetical protein